MKKQISLAFALFMGVALISCQNKDANTESEEQSQNVENQQVIDEVDKDELQEGPVSETSIAPLEIKVEDLTDGDVLLGHKVKSVKYQETFVFEIQMDGEYCFEGTLGLGMSDGIEFTPNETYRSKAQLMLGDVQKPLYMWTSFHNEAALRECLTEAQLTAVGQGDLLDVSLCLTNYSVSANMYEISAQADFVSLK